MSFSKDGFVAFDAKTDTCHGGKRKFHYQLLAESINIKNGFALTLNKHLLSHGESFHSNSPS